MRVLVAGVGNVFFGDDGFGVEVARQLAGTSWPAGAECVDFGIRGLHLALALLDPLDLLVVADAVRRGGAPGTLYVIEPELAEQAIAEGADPHGMELGAVIATARAMGAALPRVLLVGCEPADIDPGIGLSPEVKGAAATAATLIKEIVDREIDPRASSTEKGACP